MRALGQFNVLLTAFIAGACAFAQEPAPVQDPAPQSSPKYDKAIFKRPLPPDELTSLDQLAGQPSGDVIRNKEFRKMIRAVIPDCIFHYGTDMSLEAAFDLVIKGSREPVQIRDGRYVAISGRSGPYLAGRGFIWIDMQDGIGLGGFYFHPTNGEPTPSVTIVSKQVTEQALGLNQLPPAFAAYLNQWAVESRVPPLTTRYFISGLNKKILLEHDEDFCSPVDGAVGTPQNTCQQMNANAADLDLDAAYYLEQTNHATNATAWMINGPERIAWLQVREGACGAGPDPMGCRIVMTRRQTRVIVARGAAPHPHR